MDKGGSNGRGRGGGTPRGEGGRRQSASGSERSRIGNQSTASDSVPVPSPMSRVMTVADLPALMRVLGNAGCYAESLGVQLGLDPDLVRSFERQAPNDLSKFLRLVLEARLKITSSPSTLQVICDALSEPPIRNEDLAWRLEKHFKNQPPVGPISHTSMSPEMEKFSNDLDAVYENAPMPFNPKEGPRTSNCYIKLAVVRKEKVSPEDADKFTKDTLRGGIDEIMNKKEAIELKDIFIPDNGQEKVKFVLVEGAPGIGKSTFAWELCRRRHEIEAMRRFSAVVYLSLREKEVQDADSVADLLCHHDPDTVQAVAKEVCSNRGEDILLVLDGFDEVPAHLRKSFFLAEVLRGQQLPKATVLVTSRPSARADLQSLHRPGKHDKHVEVLGFTEELIEQYASSILGSDPSLVVDFLTYVSTNPSIKSMMYVPLNSAIVVEIYQETRKAGKPIPQTTTQLYSELTLSRMWRHMEANDDQSVELPEKLEELRKEHTKVYDQLLSLAKLAFEGSVKQEVIFDRLPAGCSTLGLMTASQKLVTRRKASARYNFFHLTMQEFLSAFYISQLPGSEQKAAFEQYSDRRDDHAKKFSHMDVVWRFVAGLTGFEDIGWELVRSRMGSREEGEVNAAIVQYLYEAQEKVDCASVLGGSKVTSRILSGHSALDYFALGYCIAVSRCTWKVELSLIQALSALHRPKKLRPDPESIEMLVCGLRSQENVCGCIEHLDLSGNSLGQEQMTHLRKMPPIVSQQLLRLDVRSCKLDATALDLLSDIIPTMSSLRHLDISGNPAGEGGTVKLLQTLADTSHLHTLKMEYIPIGHDDITALTQLIGPGGSLKELCVGHDDMQDDCMESLVKTVLSPSSLTHLTLYRLDWTSVSLIPLRYNNNIVTLELISNWDSSIRSKAISNVAKVLAINTTLEELSIKPPKNTRLGGVQPTLTISGDISVAFADLSAALNDNRTLKVLELGIDYRGEGRSKAANSLIGALVWRNRTLKQLLLNRSWKTAFSSAETSIKRRIHFQ